MSQEIVQTKMNINAYKINMDWYKYMDKTIAMQFNDHVDNINQIEDAWSLVC